jgi:hypothetical protein
LPMSSEGGGAVKEGAVKMTIDGGEGKWAQKWDRNDNNDNDEYAADDVAARANLKIK